MRHIKTQLALMALQVPLLCLAQEKYLDIDPVHQRTREWCWVSCGEMIFKYYDICSINPAGDFQCGIIALLGPTCNLDCYSCPVPAGSTQRIINMLDQYPQVARSVCGSTKLSVSCTDRLSAITPSEVVNDIESDMPILAGINPMGNAVGNESAHATLITGYTYNGSDLFLIVNDPFIYPTHLNPYLQVGADETQSGQYRISYSVFRQSLQWNRTLKSIR